MSGVPPHSAEVRGAGRRGRQQSPTDESLYALNHCPLELPSSTRTEILCKVATIPGQQRPAVKFRFNPSGRTSETGFNSITRFLGNRPGATEMTTPLDSITATKNPPHPGRSPQPASTPTPPSQHPLCHNIWLHFRDVLPWEQKSTPPTRVCGVGTEAGAGGAGEGGR